MADLCPFCAELPADTEEHVIPKWLSRAIKAERRGNRRFRFHARYGNEPRGSSALLNYVAHVCGFNCNWDWMSQLETATKPILTPLMYGRRAVLRAPEQHTLSMWAVKTAMMMDLYHREQKSAAHAPYIPADHFHWLYDQQLPPPGTIVQAAAYAGPERGGTMFSCNISSADANGRPVGSAYCFTLRIEYLILKVVGHDYPEDPRFAVVQ